MHKSGILFPVFLKDMPILKLLQIQKINLLKYSLKET
jgi:hypothetical protein